MIVICKDSAFEKGIALLEEYLSVRPSEKFTKIIAKEEKTNSAVCKYGELEISYATLNDAYYMLGKALTQKTADFSFTLERKIKNAGIMLDCARNAVIKPAQAKKMIAVSAMLGYNYFELYTEDCLEVDNEPYFGYMRGRFTQTEIKDLDEYAKIFGVELVPCIQTLAHLERLFFHWREYYSILDKNNVLLTDDDRTYELLENVIKTCRKCFSSKHINIGMDEAFDLGLGKHLTVHGYQPRGEIIRRHLRKVLDICKKYDFHAAMWGDMFYEDMEGGRYEGIPQDVELIYWEYGIKQPNEIRNQFAQMLPSGAKCSYAGSVTKYLGFAPHNRYSQLAIDSQIEEVAECVDSYLMTAWGDDGGEAAHFSILPGLCYFAGKNICEGLEYINEICRAISNYTYDEMCLLDEVNYPTEEKDYTKTYNPCKFLFYADPLIGVEEIAALPTYPKEYIKISKLLKPLCKRESDYSYLFDTMYALSRFLELKSYIVEELYYAYKKGDKKELGALTEKLKKSMPRLNAFIKAYDTQWRKESKELGYEVQQIRMHGMKGRLLDIIHRLEKYLDGDLDKIEELEETKHFQPLTVEGGFKGARYHLYVANVTYGKI